MPSVIARGSCFSCESGFHHGNRIYRTRLWMGMEYGAWAVGTHAITIMTMFQKSIGPCVRAYLTPLTQVTAIC